MGISLKSVDYIAQRGTPWETHILHHINLSFEIGESFAVIGPSGSGKSTLFKAISGLISPTTGTIEKTITESCMVFQEPHRGFFSVSVWDEVAYGLRFRKFHNEIIEEKTANILHRFRIPKDYWQRSPYHLSGGEQRRLAIACALVLKPQVLLFDEPTIGLDGRGYNEILDLIDEIKANDSVLLGIISHDVDFLFKLTERIILFQDGCVLNDSSWEHWKEFCHELAAMKISLPLALQVIKDLERSQAFDLSIALNYQETIRILRSFWKAGRP